MALLAGPEVCVGTVAADAAISTANNIKAYVDGELSAEQLLDKQLLLTATSAVDQALDPAIEKLIERFGEQSPELIKYLLRIDSSSAFHYLEKALSRAAIGKA